MTDVDIELLDLAAKAAGIKVLLRSPGYWNIEVHERGMRGWNPLIDDGDALRLAVKLGMTLNLSPHHGKWATWSERCPAVRESGYPESEPFAETRLAIVKAAAAVGRAMP